MLDQLAIVYRDVLQELDRGAILDDRLKPDQGPPVTQIVALGKAAAPMALIACRYSAPPREGFVVSKDGHLGPRYRDGLWGFECWETGHPLPDQRSQLAAQRLLAWIEEVRKPGHLLLLLSGGASSLLEVPAPPLTLGDLKALNQALLASGLPIEEINVIRKHLSLIKGGQLGLKLAQRFRRVTQLIFSDICLPHPERHLDLVGSGPALADPSTVEQARAGLAKLQGVALPSLLRKCESALTETPKQLTLTAELLADHRTLARLARKHTSIEAREDPEWSPVVSGDVRKLATDWSRLAQRLQSQGFKGTLIASGEPTVALSPQASGRGGRCQELAAHFARNIAGADGITLLAGSSDGTDGPTPYAGARVDGRSWPLLEGTLGAQRAAMLLAHNDSSTLFEAVPGLLLDTGPTGHNLNDLYLLSIA